jgi:hypothetical protein
MTADMQTCAGNVARAQHQVICVGTGTYMRSTNKWRLITIKVLADLNLHLFLSLKISNFCQQFLYLSLTDSVGVRR